MRVLALVLVFAFAALGGAYAMWSDTLIVDETVKTGKLNVRWDTDMHIPDPSPNYLGYEGNVYGTDGLEGLDELDPGNPNDAKNIGFMDAKVVNQKTDDDGAFSNKDDSLVITLGNGYPGYQERIYTKIINDGTVPAKFDIDAIGIPPWCLVEIWFDADPTKVKDNGEDYMVWSSEEGAQSILPLQGYQIDPNEEIAVAIYTRVLQSAPQKTTEAFTINLKAIQWNEFGLPNEGIYTNPDGDSGILPSQIITENRKDPNYDGSSGQEPDPKYTP